MNKIQYLIGLTPEKRLIAGMMVVISFLVSYTGIQSYNYSAYRSKMEIEQTKTIQKQAAENIALYNRLIDGQTKRAELLDSTIKKANDAVNKVDDQIHK